MRNLLFFLSLCFGVVSFAMADTTTTMYVSPEGNDSNPGLTADTAFRSISAALDRAYSGEFASDSIVAINILGGSYTGQSARIKFPVSAPEVRVTGEIKGSKRPVFQKGKPAQAWLSIYAKEGQDLKLSISNIEIRKYFSAIAIVGDRNNVDAGSRGLIVKNNIFREIGSQPDNSNGNISTGVIRLINSSNGQIINNKFISIRNSKGCDALHAIYLAHHSSANLIRGNTFDGTCGAAIKLRDRADNNHITRNTFANLENVSAVQEWFCDQGARKGCTKESGECPSVNNVAEQNSYPPNRSKNQNIEIAARTTPRSWCSEKQFSTIRVNAR